MARQLDILALEPFYGGVRKQTLELISRHSRHRWTILKLPARRLERRLNTASLWFSQQVSRMGSPSFDLVFTSDAMNLADFQRVNPAVGHKPSVAYVYCNQFAGTVAGDQQARVALLGTANVATELWFSSLYHMKGVLSASAAMYDGHPELGGKELVRALVAKSQFMAPPVEIVPPAKDSNVVDAERKGRTICIDTRDTDPAIFVGVLKEISNRKEPIAVHIMGKPIPGIPDGIPVVHVDPRDDAETIRAFRCCEIFISSQKCEHFDPLAMRAMAMGCIPVLLRDGYYSEFLPKALQTWCMYDGSGGELLSRIMDLWYLRRPAVARRELDVIFDRYTPIGSTRNFDQRLAYLCEQHAARLAGD